MVLDVEKTAIMSSLPSGKAPNPSKINPYHQPIEKVSKDTDQGREDTPEEIKAFHSLYILQDHQSSSV